MVLAKWKQPLGLVLPRVEKRTKAEETVVIITSVIKSALCLLPRKECSHAAPHKPFLHAESHAGLLSTGTPKSGWPSLLWHPVSLPEHPHSHTNLPTQPASCLLPARTTAALFYRTSFLRWDCQNSFSLWSKWPMTPENIGCGFSSHSIHILRGKATEDDVIG